MTLAKGTGGGFPIGALLTFGSTTSALLTAGQHGTTFGGNPVATAAALATLHAIESRGVLQNVQSVGSTCVPEFPPSKVLPKSAERAC